MHATKNTCFWSVTRDESKGRAYSRRLSIWMILPFVWSDAFRPNFTQNIRNMTWHALISEYKPWVVSKRWIMSKRRQAKVPGSAQRLLDQLKRRSHCKRIQRLQCRRSLPGTSMEETEPQCRKIANGSFLFTESLMTSFLYPETESCIMLLKDCVVEKRSGRFHSVRSL